MAKNLTAKMVTEGIIKGWGPAEFALNLDYESAEEFTSRFNRLFQNNDRARSEKWRKIESNAKQILKNQQRAKAKSKKAQNADKNSEKAAETIFVHNPEIDELSTEIITEVETPIIYSETKNQNVPYSEVPKVTVESLNAELEETNSRIIEFDKKKHLLMKDNTTDNKRLSKISVELEKTRARLEVLQADAEKIISEVLARNCEINRISADIEIEELVKAEITQEIEKMSKSVVYCGDGTSNKADFQLNEFGLSDCNINAKLIELINIPEVAALKVSTVKKIAQILLVLEVEQVDLLFDSKDDEVENVINVVRKENEDVKFTFIN